MVHINEGKDKLALLYTAHNVLSTPPFSILFPSSIFFFFPSLQFYYFPSSMFLFPPPPITFKSHNGG